MANGIPSLNPFPQFGGKQSPGITPVQLQPAQIRFPTSRFTPQRRPLEPTSKETFAPLAPLLMEGIFSALQKQPERLTDEQYLLSIGADPEDPTKLQQTQLDAYKLYGPTPQNPGFGISDVANIVAASQMGRGAKDYASTYLNLRKAKDARDARTTTAKASYISTQMTPRSQSILLMDKDAAETGNPADMYYTGLFDPTSETYFYLNPETQKFEDIRGSGRNLLPAKSFLEAKNSNPFLDDAKKKAYDEYLKLDGTLRAQESALLGVTVAIGETVDALEVAEKDPKMNPVSFLSSLTNMANSAFANFDQAGAMLGGGNIDNYFADATDVRDGIGGSRGREGTGDNAKALYEAIKSGNETQIEIELKRFEEANADYLETLGIRKLFQEIGYQNVRAQANLLSLAYQAAAANGQTGRTLSDKDLAFHLQMVGFGATQDPTILKDNLLAFGDQLIQRADEQAKTGYGRLIKAEVEEYKGDPNFQRLMRRWYTSDDNFNTYIDFYTRNQGIDSVDKFRGFERRKSVKEQEKEKAEQDKIFQNIDLTVQPGSITS